MSETKKNRVLLPTDVTPVHYTLHLTPDFQTFTFEGKEQIRVKVHKPTKSITLHAVDINFHSVAIESSEKQIFVAKRIEFVAGILFFTLSTTCFLRKTLFYG
jgi:aminopeptidase N